MNEDVSSRRGLMKFEEPWITLGGDGLARVWVNAGDE